MKSRIVLWIALVLFAVFPFELPAQENSVRLTPEEFERLTPEAYWSFNHCRSTPPEVLDSSPGRRHLTLTGIGASCVKNGKYGRGLGLGIPPGPNTVPPERSPAVRALSDFKSGTKER